jgi:hypothetical protein
VYDFLLFVHVLFAFGLVAAITTFWAVTIASRPARMSLPPAGVMTLGRTAGILVGVSALGVVVFGVWLAIYLDAYHPWDGWVISAIVLWMIATGLGVRTREVLVPAGEGVSALSAGDDSQRAATLHWIRTVVVIALLAVMIFKPGA